MAEEIAVLQRGELRSKAGLDDADALSLQERAKPMGESTLSTVAWFVSRPDDELISPYWSPARDYDLRDFVKRSGNDILAGAQSSIIKKFKSMNWVLEGPQRVVSRYQKLLAHAEFWHGWGSLLSKTIEDYTGQDKGAYWELIGDGPINGEMVGPVLGIAHMDSQFVQLTGDIEFPVIFHSAKTGKPHKVHSSRVIHLVDMPSPNQTLNNVGWCAVSRVINSSEILLKIARYKKEKLDDLPEAGLLLLNNIRAEAWKDATANYQRERRRLNQQHWANVLTFFGLDPAQPATADFINFSNLPDAFDELQSTNIYINIVALAFGVDVREFWPITGGSLGTATESQIMHEKARGKGIGDLISTLERGINWKILPESAVFRFDFKNDEEDKLSAEIDQTRTNTIMSMWQPGGPVSGEEIRQMLADNISYFKDEFLGVDMTPEHEARDTHISKMFGPMVQIDSKGRVKSLNSPHIYSNEMKAAHIAVKKAEQGRIGVEDVPNYTLSEVRERSRRT